MPASYTIRRSVPRNTRRSKPASTPSTCFPSFSINLFMAFPLPRGDLSSNTTNIIREQETPSPFGCGYAALWDFLRNDALQPSNPRFHTKSPLKQNQFGGTFGGPVFLPKLYNGKDRTFFFVSYQGGCRRTASFGQAQMPTSQERQSDFSDWPTQLYDPLSGAPNPGATP